MPHPVTFFAIFERSRGAAGECWRWAGNRWYKGYPWHANDPAYRRVYREYVGPIPEGLEIDHLCRNRWCVNPAHLEAVDHRTNTLRSSNFIAVNARKTHCVNGHELTRENTGINSTTGGRYCRICNSASKRRYKQRKRRESSGVTVRDVA